MDPTKEAVEIDIDDLLSSTITVNDYSSQVYNGGAVTGSFGYDYANISCNITVPSAQDTITLSSGWTTGLTYPGNITTGSLSNTAIGAGAYNTSSLGMPWASTTGNLHSNKITLDGDDADINVNGQSLMTMLKTIEERLNILVPNAEMEKEWDQLRDLGEQYRVLEAKLKEQGDMWAKLKAMPPPIL
jgi:hypothetical protein